MTIEGRKEIISALDDLLNAREALTDARKVLRRVRDAKSYHTVGELADWARVHLEKYDNE